MPYVAEAVQSVLNQTYRDLELLVVDDASTDGSAVCLQSFTDSRIRLWRNEQHQGQTRCLNDGLRLARGAYVARLDADDVCVPDRLRKQVAWLDGHPDTAVVGTWMRAMSPAGRDTTLLGRRLDNDGTFVGWLLLGTCPLLHPSVMFRREIVVGVGGYDESFRIAQDYALWIRLALSRHQAAILPEPLGRYRLHPHQQSVADALPHQQEIRRAHTQFIERFCKKEAAETVSRLLRMDDAFWDLCASKTQLLSAIDALHAMLSLVKAQLHLGSGEWASLRRLVFGWLGPGVQVLPVLKRRPSWLVYAVLFLGSPLLVPTVRRRLSWMAGTWRRVRHAASAILHDWSKGWM
jgi:hypothetical protein